MSIPDRWRAGCGEALSTLKRGIARRGLTGLRPGIAWSPPLGIREGGDGVVPHLAAFKMPTLIIHGTDDQTVPIAASARLAARGIPGCRLIEYDGAPYGLFASDKDRLVKDLLDFFAD